ncbi:MAG TPA: hypothetical protein VIR34_17390 [Gemmatimonadaceae bacterium]|jgi:hypothetical protein
MDMRLLRHPPRRASSVLLGVLLLAATTVHAQAEPADTPEAVAKQLIAALGAGDFAANAALMHPSALATFRRFVVGLSASDTSGATLEQVFGVTSSAALDTLSDTQLYARFFGKMVAAQPEMGAAIRSATYAIVGHVDEAPDLAHVVYRMTMTVDGIPVRKVDVLTLRRYGSTWRALLTTDLENLISRVSAQGR